MQRRTMQNRVREALKLQSIDVRIRSKHPVVLPITHAEALHIARAQIPGIGGLANHAAILTVHLEALVPVHAHCHCQIKVTHTAIGKFSSDKPAIRSELLNEPGLDAHDLAPQKAGSIDEMAPVA